jgi:hypothetical protein
MGAWFMFGGGSRPRARATSRPSLGGAILATGFLLAGCVGGGVGNQSPTTVFSELASPTAPPSTAPTLTPVPQGSTSSGATGCVSLNIDYGPDARGKAGDLVGLASTTIAGIQAGDVVERGEPTDGGSSVQVVRAGEVIGTVVYSPDRHGGWLPVSGVLCSGLSYKS